MGCNQTKSSDSTDVKKSQETRQRQVDKPMGGGPASQPVGIHSEITTNTQIFRDAKVSIDAVAKSYTDQREGELYFKNIIDRTASNFIDVYSSPAPLEGIHAENKAMSYAKKMKPVSVNEAATFALPTPSASNSTSPGSLLSGTVDASELDMIQKYSDQMLNAMKGMSINDCGTLVVSFL